MNLSPLGTFEVQLFKWFPPAQGGISEQKKNASVDLVTRRRGDPLMGDLEIMEMFLLEPRGAGGGRGTQVTQRALLTCTKRCSTAARCMLGGGF